MNITAALYRAAHEYPQGMAVLAGFVGCSEHSLQHKVSPNYPGAHCSPQELVTICEITGDLSPLQAQAAKLGQMLLPLPASQRVDGDLSRRLAATCQEFGEMLTEMSSDLADGAVTPNEQRRIEREAGELIASVHALLSYTAGLVEKAKPVNLKVAG